MYSECRCEYELDVWREKGDTYVLFVHEVIKNCPRYWEVALSGPKLNVSSDSLLGAQ